jgi:hypothetical protein
VARSAVRAALSEHARAETQREQLGRLVEGFVEAPLELPYLFCDRLGRAQLEELATALEHQL